MRLDLCLGWFHTSRSRLNRGRGANNRLIMAMLHHEHGGLGNLGVRLVRSLGALTLAIAQGLSAAPAESSAPSNESTNGGGPSEAAAGVALAEPAAVESPTTPQPGETSIDDEPVLGPAPIERIETALGEAISPLDAVEVDIDNSEYEKAQTFLTAYIRALESARHRHHGDLARPLTLLGDAQFGLGNYIEALQSYAMAVHVSRVHDGLFTPLQVEAVYKQSQALQRLGQPEEASSREQYAFEVLYKAHGPESEALLPGIFRLARWHNDSYNIFAARRLYEQALKIHAANGNMGQPAAIPALQGLVETYRMERFPPFYTTSERGVPSYAVNSRPGLRTSTFDAPLTINNFPVAERALQEIIRIRRTDLESGPVPVSKAILELADWHLLWERFNKAEVLYEHVYSVFEKLDDVDADGYFAKPKLLHIPLPRDPKPPPVKRRGEQSTGFVKVGFGVSPTGGVQSMAVLASEPKGLMDFPVRRSLRNARYRPALVDGQTALYESETYRHEFKYFEESEKEEEDNEG